MVSVIGVLVVLIGNTTWGVVAGLALALLVIIALIGFYSYGNEDRQWQTRITAVSSLGLMCISYGRTAPALVDVYRTTLKNNIGYAIAEKRTDLAEYFNHLLEVVEQSQRSVG